MVQLQSYQKSHDLNPIIFFERVKVHMGEDLSTNLRNTHFGTCKLIVIHMGEDLS